MRGDRRQIQTAVLGSADSEEPLMLPMEAIELDAFRHHYESDTFWCGILLGGCGGQLTTKLYTDRACHFAHHPDPDGLPHVCGRRARGVTSADHLYVKSAAAAWLVGRGEQASFEYTRPDGAPLGSVVDVRWRHGALRVHLDQAVAPVWDNGMEPVLGTMVPVDRDTLIRRWYVHRIRLHSEGTARRVRIGTEAFARPVEWFSLDECEMTERGLSTPAVERIIRSRSTPPPSRWTPGKTHKGPNADARARGLLRQLADAQRVDSVVMVRRISDQIAGLNGAGEETQEQMTAAVADVRHWLEKQAEARRDLFARLEKATTDQDARQVRELLLRTSATATQDHTPAEDAIVERATAYFASLPHTTQELLQTEATARKAAAKATARARTLLKTLRRHDAYDHDLQPQVRELLQAAAAAGEGLTAGQEREVALWKQRAADGAPTPPLHKQVSRRYWKQGSCPRCHAGRGASCVLAEGSHVGEVRAFPHDERLQPIVDERKARQRKGAAAAVKTQGAEGPKNASGRGIAAPIERQNRTRPQPKTDEPRLHHQVAYGDWYRGECPRCHAGPGKPCANDDRVGPGRTRQIPHDERLRRILQTRPAQPRRKKRKEQETGGSPARTWHAMDVTCPKCDAAPQSPCTPHGTHRERGEWAKEFTRKLWG